MTRILLVEDEGIIALHMQSTLSRLGYEVSLASNSQEAIDLAQRLPPQVLLMDVSLRGSPLDGEATNEAIQRLHPVPVVYLTGYADQPTLSRIIEHSQAPITRVLSKPVDPARLASVVQEVLGES